MFRERQQFSSGNQSFTLIKELGRGAFGEVWLAEYRTLIMTKEVAVKLPKSENVDVESFRKEVQAWTRAGTHPNLLPLCTADIFSGQVVIASEYISEGTLSEWLKHGRYQGPFPTAESVVHMTSNALKGLAHLHSKGIVHRDLKPANILLQNGNPLIADFGLARFMKSDSSTQMVGGTPVYMSPEVWAEGDRSIRADLWAVGIILFQMLQGALPFFGGTNLEVQHAVIHSPTPRLLNPIFSRFQSFIDKALDKNPAKRFQSAEEMLNAVTALGLRTTTSPISAHKTQVQTPNRFETTSNNLLLGVAVDVSGSMRENINNRDSATLSRLDAFQRSLGSMIRHAEQRLRNQSAPENQKQTTIDTFVYGFGLRLVPHCDLLALLQVFESETIRTEIECVRNRIINQARRNYSGYGGLINLANLWGFGDVVDAVSHSAEEQIREKILNEIRPLLEQQLCAIGDVTVGLADLASRWRSSNTSIQGAESALFGDTPMCSALRSITERFNRELSREKDRTPILFLLSDGEATDGNPVPLGVELKEMNVTVVSCFIAGHNTANPRVIFGKENPNWQPGAKQMFGVASEVQPNSEFARFLVQNGWEIQPHGRLFIQANHSEVLEEFINIVLSPLGSVNANSLGPVGQ